MIYDKVRALMLLLVQSQEIRVPAVHEEKIPVTENQTLFSEDLMNFFDDFVVGEAVDSGSAEDLNGGRADEEIERWETTPASIQMRGDCPETVLEFWQRQATTSTFNFLPLVARTVFAIPAPSAPIERDFVTAKQLVAPQRGSISPHSVDISTFLNCNRQCVDMTQWPKIRERDINNFIPSNVKVRLEDDNTKGCDLMSGYFSAESDEEDDTGHFSFTTIMVAFTVDPVTAIKGE